jgi:hypothetical protein
MSSVVTAAHFSYFFFIRQAIDRSREEIDHEASTVYEQLSRDFQIARRHSGRQRRPKGGREKGISNSPFKSS